MIFYTTFISALSLTSLIGLILAYTGLFNGLIFLPVFACIMILGLLQYVKYAPTYSFKSSHLLLVGILILGAYFYFTPYEYVDGGWDPGTYSNTGVHLSQTGSLSYHDSFLEDMNTQDRTWYAGYLTKNNTGKLYPGKYIINVQKGFVIPEFFPLFPVLIAFFNTIFGLQSILFVNPVFAIFSLLAFFIFIKNISDIRTALTATLLFSLCPIQIWNARFGTSEILAQFFILNGFLFLERSATKKSLLFGMLSGLLFGLSLLTAVTCALLVPTLFFLYLFSFYKSRKADLAFALTFLIFVGLFLYQNLVFNPMYYRQVTSFFSRITTEQLYIIIPGITVCSSIIVVFSKKLAQFSETITFKSMVSISFLLGLLYFALIHPQIMSNMEGNNLHELSWFTGYAFLLVGSLGCILFIFTGAGRKSIPFLLSAVIFTAFFLWNKRMFPRYPFSLRRYTLLTIPAFSFFVAYFLSWIARKRLKAGTSLAVIATIIIAALPLWKNRILLRTIDYKGMLSFLSDFNQHIPDNALIFCEDYRLGRPFEDMFGRSVISMSGYRDNFTPIERHIATALENGKDCFFLSARERPFTYTIDFIPYYRQKRRSRFLESTIGTFPSTIKDIQYELTLYELVQIPNSQHDLTSGYKIDLGENPIGLLDGWDKPRYFQDDTFRCRWTKGSATIQLPDALTPEDLFVHITAKNPRPRAAKPVLLSVFLNNDKKNDVLIPASRDYTQITIPLLKRDFSNKNTPYSIKLSIPTWNPYERGISSDKRNLGLLIASIELISLKDNEPVAYFSMDGQEDNLLTGFYPAEQDPEEQMSIRWTFAEASLIIPWFGDKTDQQLKIKCAGKAGTPSTRATFLINNQEIARDMEIGNNTEILIIPIFQGSIDTGDSSRAVLTIKATPWDPSEDGIDGYPGNLGIMVDWIEIKTVHEQKE